MMLLMLLIELLVLEEFDQRYMYHQRNVEILFESYGHHRTVVIQISLYTRSSCGIFRL
jgi:hypothetical protein